MTESKGAVTAHEFGELCEWHDFWYLSLVDAGTPPTTVSVVGESAGAGLAMSLLLALRDGQHPLPGSALLMCPWVDLSGVTQRHPEEASSVISTAATARFAELYLAGHPSDDPVLAPLSADLSGLPSILVQAATGDSLAPEAQMLVDRARAAGVDIALELYPIPTHSFQLFWTFHPEAADALQRGGNYLKR